MKLKIYEAKDGKVWKSKISGEFLSTTLILGKEDKLANYEQVDPPVFEDEG